MRYAREMRRHTSRQTRSLVTALVAALIATVGCTDSGSDGPLDDVIGFSDLRIEDIAATRAVMRGDTSIAATCAVEYGLSMDNLEWTATDPEMEEGEVAINHQVPLEDLTPETTYYLRALAEGPDGEMGVSDILMFTTTVDPGNDPTADMVNVALLDEGTTVAGVSSNWGDGDNDSGFGIHKALDGLEGTEWSSNGDGNDAWVELDFGQARTVSYFAYRSRMMADGTSIVTSVRVIDSDSGEPLGTFATPDHQVRYVFSLPEPITTQRVRVEMVETTGGNTGAREIQFFAPM